MLAQEKYSFARIVRVLRATIWFLLLVLVTMGIFGKRGLLDLRRMQRENLRIERELIEARQNHDLLGHQIIAIQKDPQMQEHTIRKVLGYIRPDETVIEF